MNDYHKILEIQSLIINKESRINKYKEVEIQAQDNTLRKLIKNRIEDRTCSTIKDLKDYCVEQIEIEKATRKIVL